MAAAQGQLAPSPARYQPAALVPMSEGSALARTASAQALSAERDARLSAEAETTAEAQAAAAREAALADMLDLEDE